MTNKVSATLNTNMDKKGGPKILQKFDPKIHGMLNESGGNCTWTKYIASTSLKMVKRREEHICQWSQRWRAWAVISEPSRVKTYSGLLQWWCFYIFRPFQILIWPVLLAFIYSCITLNILCHFYFQSRSGFGANFPIAHIFWFQETMLESQSRHSQSCQELLVFCCKSYAIGCCWE